MGLFNFFKKEVKTEIPLNTAVFTTERIIRENALITRIYHSSDNYFSFMDNYSENTNEDIMVVSLGNILERDNSVKQTLNIPVLHYAYRKSLTDNWEIAAYVEDDEDDDS